MIFPGFPGVLSFFQVFQVEWEPCVHRGVSATQPPGAYAPPPGRHPPAQCMLGYGQQAGGTHPTGMHTCFFMKVELALRGASALKHINK